MFIKKVLSKLLDMNWFESEWCASVVQWHWAEIFKC